MTNNETRDFYLAAYLMACGYRIISHSRTGPITTFIFDSTEELLKQIESYYNMKAMIEPITYGNAIKSLKTIIHSYANTNSNSNGGSMIYAKSERSSR